LLQSMAFMLRIDNHTANIRVYEIHIIVYWEDNHETHMSGL